MAIVLQQLGILFAFVFVGYILAKTGIIKSEQSKIISSLLVYVFSPAVSLNSFAKNFTVEYLTEKYQIFIISIVVLVVLGITSFFAAKLLSKEDFEQKVYTYSLVVPNYGYMGYALAAGIFGDKMLMDVIVVGIPLTFFIYSIGFPMLTNVKKVNFKNLINPSLITIVLGSIIGLAKIQIPSVLETLLENAGNCMAPLAMILMGITISEFKLIKLFKNYKVYMLSFLRLVIIPLVIAISLWFTVDKNIIIPILLVYILPCGLNSVVFPKLIGENCETGASIALISSLFSIITIPIWLSFFV